MRPGSLAKVTAETSIATISLLKQPNIFKEKNPIDKNKPTMSTDIRQDGTNNLVREEHRNNVAA
jgi:hypothetical protein